MNEDRMKVLRMLEEKKITAEEASRLLDALNGTKQDVPVKAENDDKPNRWLRVRVSEDGKEKVKVNIPLKLVEIITKIEGVIPPQARAQLDEHDIDLGAIIQAIREGADGEIVTVEDGDEKVYVYVE